MHKKRKHKNKNERTQKRKYNKTTTKCEQEEAAEENAAKNARRRNEPKKSAVVLCLLSLSLLILLCLFLSFSLSNFAALYHLSPSKSSLTICHLSSLGNCLSPSLYISFPLSISLSLLSSYTYCRFPLACGKLIKT